MREATSVREMVHDILCDAAWLARPSQEDRRLGIAIVAHTEPALPEESMQSA